MAAIKQADFDNLLAANAWVDLNRQFIQVLEFKNVIDDFWYPTSARLKRPRIILKYLDFRESGDVVLIPDGAILFGEDYLIYETGEYLVYE